MNVSLSIIVACCNAAASIRDCLDSLVQQGEADVELIVVDNSDDGSAEIVRAQFPGVRMFTMPSQALINELWSTGILQSCGDIVALTTAHCIPAPDWIAQVRKAHGTPAAGVGGAIDGDSESSLVDWAVCFCRYSRFLPPIGTGVVDDIPADNAAYKRAPLFRHQAQWRDGFWEPQLHHALAREGEVLWLAPAMQVRHRHSFGFSGFMRQRFLHGQKYGGWRASTLTPAKRVMMLIASPLIPLVLLQRTARRVMGKGGYRLHLFATLPLLAVFFIAWACGEALGYARGSAQ